MAGGVTWLDGKQVTGLSLMERKELPSRILEDNETLRKIAWVDTEGVALWDAVRAEGLEGMVAKRKKPVCVRPAVGSLGEGEKLPGS